MPTTPSRLSKSARREQLLDTALEVVRTTGADGLTLPTLAEAAGVSRPVVYEHFRTRPGLLLALYERLDEGHRTTTAQALREADPTMEAVAHATSTAYFACATDMPELDAVAAALKGDPAAEEVRRAMDDRYTALMVEALRPHSGLAADALRMRCVGVLGAAEAIAGELHRGRTTLAGAVVELSDLIVRSIETGTTVPDCQP